MTGKRINLLRIVSWSLVVIIFGGGILFAVGILVTQFRSPAEGTAEWYWKKGKECQSAGLDAELWGQSDEAREYFNEAIKYFNDGIELYPHDLHLFWSRAYTYAEIGEYELAIEDYSKAIMLDPESRSLYYGRSLMYEKLRMDELAITDLMKCIELTKNRRLIEIYEGRIEDIRMKGQ